MKTRAEMVVAPRKVPFEESLKFANIQMKIENPSLVFPDEPTALKLEAQSAEIERTGGAT